MNHGKVKNDMKKRTTVAALLVLGLSGAVVAPSWAEEPNDAAPVSQAAPAPENVRAVEPSSPVEVAQTTPAETAPVTEDSKKAAEKALLEGRELMRKGFSESAIVQYRKAIELDPDLAQAYIELGKILMDTKNQAFAITIYRKLADLQPQSLQWKEILFDLHTAYEMPKEAAVVGEEILLQKPNDLAFIKRLAEVYKGYGLQDKYAETLLKGAAVSNSAKMYFDAGEAYFSADYKNEAVSAYRQAVALEPKNLEYQNALGKGLNAAGDPYAARELYASLVEQFPQAAGLKDRQAETELAVGDRLLQTRRYVAARKSYERAKDLMGKSSSTQGLGVSVQERIEKAQRLNHVSIDTPFQVGKQGDNSFYDFQQVINFPLGDTDLAVQLWHDYREASSSTRGTVGFDNFYGGIDWKPTEYDAVYALGGSNGIFRVGVNHQDDIITGGLEVKRDIVSYTPDGIRQRMDYIGVNGNLAYQISDLFSLGGSFASYSYGDNISEFTYNIGPRFTPINRPNDFVWGIGYNHGGISNTRDADQNVRFGPTNFQVDSFGTDIEHWVSDSFRYRLGYYYSTTNVGVSGNTFLVGLDAQLNEASYLFLNYEYGNFLAGRVAPGLFSANASNYILNGGLHFTF
jgi:tetratricopeptide (TPR) repeat protein